MKEWIVAMEILAVVSEFLGLIKRKELEKAQDVINQEIMRYRCADYHRRVQCIDEINKCIFNLNLAVQTIEAQYNEIMVHMQGTTVMHSLEEYLSLLKEKISELKQEKRRLSRPTGKSIS